MRECPIPRPLTAVTGPADHSTSVGRRGDDLCLSCPPAEQEISPSDPCMIVGRAVRSGQHSAVVIPHEASDVLTA
jgi:hypothetical protein